VTGLLAPALLALAAARTPGESILVNGSFEEGPAVGGFLNLAGGATAIPGWIVTGEGIDYVGRYWVSADGLRAIDLDGSARSRATPPHPQGGIAQTFATTPGTRYRVTFDMAGNPNRPPAVKPMRVSAAGEQAEFTFDITGRSGSDMGWVSKSWEFTANDGSTTLEFRSLTVSPLTGYGAAIDRVSVVALDGPPPLEVRESDEEIRIALGAEVLFDSGRYTLGPAATETLQELAAVLKSHPGLPILIEGHTDGVGRPEANQTLSENRARAVKDWLTANGEVPAERITTLGLGQTMPVDTNDTAAGRQRNRRVEVRLRKAAPPNGG
jgi:choice-of-anchor C domain-containing protein